MGYISKLDTKFVTFVSRKYDRVFNYFDDYVVWLYNIKKNEEKYYAQLEMDLWEYSDSQTGSPRSRGKGVNK